MSIAMAEALDGNGRIEAVIDAYYADAGKKTLLDVLDSISVRMYADGHFLFPLLMDEHEKNGFAFRTL